MTPAPRPVLLQTAPPESLTGFQVIALALLGAVLLWEVWRFVSGPVSWGNWALRCAVWLAAAAAIARPQLTQDVAGALGIGRGADVILYVFVLAFLGTSFYWYSRHVRTERRLTEVVRQLALREARQGGNARPTG